MNSIVEKQNSTRAIAQLAAQRRLYSEAKRVLTVQILLGGPLAMASVVLIAMNPDARAVVALWGLGVALADLLFLTPMQKRYREHAATIQESFDCEVLEMPWNEVKVGRPVEPELVKEWSEKFKGDAASLHDWYPVSVAALPLAAARVVCQRSNCWWDSKQRRRYAGWILSILLCMIAASAAIGMLSELTFKEFSLALLAPLTPGVVLAIRQRAEQVDVADRGERLKDHVERLWNDACSGLSEERLTVKSRAFQDEIFENRRRGPLVFDWIYARLKDEQEQQMNHAAKDLVETALRTFPTASAAPHESPRG